MQTDEQREKLDEVSRLINQFSELGNRSGQKFKVASPVYEAEDGAFQVARHKGTWELLWIEGEKVQDIRTTSVAIKRKFLVIAEGFFRRYVEIADNWEKTIDTDIDQGRKALIAAKDMIA